MGVNKFNPNSRKFNKTNFVELIELITPNVYQSEDLDISGVAINPISEIINSHIQAANNIVNILPLSAVENTQTSTLDTIEGISQYFIKQNNLTRISPFLFESKILVPLGRSIRDFDTSADFHAYLSGILLPQIIPSTNISPGAIQDNITTLSALTNNSDASSVHNYLVDSLGWYYFLNTSAGGGLDYSPSSYVLDGLDSLYMGNELGTLDGIKGFTEYIWKNHETIPSMTGLIPAPYLSGVLDGITNSVDGVLPTYTSGTQRLDNLKTMLEVIYSPSYLDQTDFTVKEAFDSYIEAQLLLDDLVSQGPLRKFNNLLGYNFADISNEVENLNLIYDIENVKEEHLQYIAELIGFKLRGNSSSKWRHQLRNAIGLYKKIGTLESIQLALNSLIVDSVFDLSGQVQELWESYLPFLIWYSLGTESPLFRDLNTWTASLAQEAGVVAYSTSSLEENLKIVTDSILLDLFREFPDHFLFHGKKFPSPMLYELDSLGCESKIYTIVGDPNMKPFHVHRVTDDGYQAFKQDAKLFGEAHLFEAAEGFGALGSGVYMAGASHPSTGERPTYLKPSGDLEFVFNFRNKENFPIPPFEEVKYYRDSTVTADMVDFLVERLKCFLVKDSFADEVGNYILSSAVTDETNLGSLNEFLMLFSSVQVPPNFDDVMMSISDYERNLLNLWNGKSSHLFIDFDDTDFDFYKTTLEGDSRYALYEAARVAREFSPAHAITRVNLNASAEDFWEGSSTTYNYLGLDKDDSRASYTSASVLAGFESFGVDMGNVAPGGSGGRGGLNTFKREDVDNITEGLLASNNLSSPVPRRALRRRNLRFLLPHEGYYDRTGFNSPVNWDLEAQNPNMLGYTVDTALDPGITFNTDLTGTVWAPFAGGQLGTFSSVLYTNPFGGVSSLILSANEVGTGRQALATHADFLPRLPKFRADYAICYSVYVKAHDNPTTSATYFELNVYDKDNPDLISYTEHFEFINGVPTIDGTPAASSTTTIEDVTNGWYRLGITVEGLANTGTSEGDDMIPIFYIGNGGNQATSDVHNKEIYWYAPQVEQHPLSYGITLPTPYQPVSGASPDISTYNDRGELTLGYVPSAGEFFPILDPINPSGVWHECETLESNKSFSGVYTSATFPYRGLSSLGSNNKMLEEGSKTARYVDRDQVPNIYRTMHNLFEKKAKDYANEQINLNTGAYNADAYWKNNIQSFANEAITSGLVLNSFEDYNNFQFGVGLHKTHRDYCKYFDKHPLGLNEIEKTGGNIIAQVFGKGLYNCDFSVEGSAVTQPLLGNFIASSLDSSIPIKEAVFSPYLANSTENLLKFPNSMGGLAGAWGLHGNCSGQNNTHIAPDGTLTAATIWFADGVGTPGSTNVTQTAAITAKSGQKYTLSAYIKKRVEDAGRSMDFIAYINTNEIFSAKFDQDTATITSVTTTTTNGPRDYTLEDVELVDVGNDWYRVSQTITDYAGNATFVRSRFYPQDQVAGGGDVSGVLWGGQIVLGDTAYTPFNGLGTYIAYGPEESVLPLVGTYSSPYNINTGQAVAYQAYNAEFRNPNILSGIEIVQTSGAPNSNQFEVFKVVDSNKVTNNPLLNNTVIKCKSLGGLPRLRFDLSSYGDRLNHFIKDHKFKLDVKALVGEENSSLLGGGKLGVWIHTKPKYLEGNRNLLSFTEDPGASPGLDFAAGNIAGTHWYGNSNYLPTFSSILETNPFGGPSSIELSATLTPGALTFWPYLAHKEEDTIVAAGYESRTKRLRSDVKTTFTWYVKRPPTNSAVSSFVMNIHDFEDTEYGNYITFEYLNGYHEATSAVPTINSTYHNYPITAILEDVGNDWYRCGLELSGLGRGGNSTNEGDSIRVIFYMGGNQGYGEGNYQNVEGQTIWLSSPQLTQQPISEDYIHSAYPISSTLAYQEVVGEVPTPIDPNGYLWTWTPNGKWEVIKEDELSLDLVKNTLAHTFTFEDKTPAPADKEWCLGDIITPTGSLADKKDEFYENHSIEFDTRNFTIHNNSEYLDIVPIENDVYEVTEQVNMDDTNYIVEVFFMPNNNSKKYLLIDSIELTDLTQRENAAIGTGHGIETSGTPLRKFVKEDKIYLEKSQLMDVLKFYNGLAGLGTGTYATDIASREATITSGTMEVSGGSRLNYRWNPSWGENSTQTGFGNLEDMELDN